MHKKLEQLMRGNHIKIELSAGDRVEPEKYAKTGKRSIKLANRARIILGLDEAEGRKPLKRETWECAKDMPCIGWMKLRDASL